MSASMCYNTLTLIIQCTHTIMDQTAIGLKEALTPTSLNIVIENIIIQFSYLNNKNENNSYTNLIF